MTDQPVTLPPLPWKTRLLMSILANLVDFTRRRDFTVNRFISDLIDIKARPTNNPINGVTTSDIKVLGSHDLWFRLFEPTTHGGEDNSLPVIVYFHGGGFSYLSASSITYDAFCKRLAKELHAVIISVNYRLAPEHKYPSQFEDGVDVLKFLDVINIENFPACANLKHCFLAGDNAGGTLAHNVIVRANEYKFQTLKLIGLIVIQPVMGGEQRSESEIRLSKSTLLRFERTDWMWKAFLPEGMNKDHPAINIFGPNAIDISGLNFPPTIVFVGGFDPLQDWQIKYYEGLKKYGKEAYLIEYPNAVHSFYAHPELPDSSLLMKDIKDFIKIQCAKN